MPELPEVETYARYFARHALDQRIVRVDVRDERILTMRKDVLARKLRGREFTEVRRHGKHLFAKAGDVWLRLHFGMTGDLAYYTEKSDEPRFARVVFDFDNGAHLAFEDMRLFGVVDLVDDVDAYIAEQRLGPDPLHRSFRLREFAALLEKRRGAIKALLMSQNILAGMGNLYTDEVLYRTSIHPRRAVDRLKEADVRAVYTTMREVLRKALLSLSREEGDRCPKCGGTIRRSVVFGRTTYFCAKHQK